MTRQRIAVIGAGIAGNAAAWLLTPRHDVTLIEAEPRLGGHANTVAVATEAGDVPVDTGFIVYNEHNYPNFVALLRHLGVATAPSEMSFSVSLDSGRLEYGTASLRNVLAQPANLLSPRFVGMLRDVRRFFRDAPRDLARGLPADLSLCTWLARGAYGSAFIDDHLLPMAAAIWSCPVGEMLAFPARSFLAFYANHGLLHLSGRPPWRTVSGGSRAYVDRLTAPLAGRILRDCPVRAVRRHERGVAVRLDDGADHLFDQVVIASHADDALLMLADPSPAESRVLGAFRYQSNTAILHEDARLMPRRRAAWQSWNYIGERDAAGDRAVSVTYWMNRLQGLDPARNLFVSLNPLVAPRPETVHARMGYRHPVYDAGAIAAQHALDGLQGRRRTWYCGSYFGYGFHEDALAAGVAVASGLGAEIPWETKVVPAGRGAAAQMDAAD